MKSTAHVRKYLIGVVAAGLLGAACAAPAAADPVAGPARSPVVYLAPPAPLLHVLPAPLDCLFTTGFALWCVGITAQS
ncbi:MULTISPECIES: hypothetical protein [unclassified Nocardia]|uniref:hypothetical protein n=1 Tax=unclassified Nocardia TaxID=2637762 RepID=UPI001CE3BDAC|nr:MULTISPECIES: hypothetical protein [unclassified Nocardia]